ncbi:MAG TPA: Calx-beta domain-containing protein, partial [Verrucomicrobiota bacterium]|nr:Calx-beta domain-containing protein [Verrucomicrobiota bacterium]
IVGGEFTTFNDKPRAHIARLNSDGSLDMTFNPICGSDRNIWSVTVFEGTPGYPLIYIGGDFTLVNGEQRNSIARINPDGTLDYSFNPGTGSDGPVYAIAVQSNGSAIIGGSFTEIDSKARNNIARLNPDGSLDLTFNPGTGPNDAVYSIILRPGDERAYIGGKFTSFNLTRRMGMVLLRSDGTLDTTFMDTAYNQFAGLIKTFSFEPNHFVRSIALQADGNLMIGGSFTNIGGNFASYLNNNGTYAPVWTRQDKVVRMNVARLIGTWGTTTNSDGTVTDNPSQGPGNIEFITDNYYIDENQPVMNITLMRVEGDMGTAGAQMYTSNRLADAGVDYGMINTSPVFSEWYRWMRSEGFPGPVYVQVPIIDDNLIEGNETVDLGLWQPFGQLTLGGEYIPLGAALGHTSSTLTIVDNDVDYGTIAFSSANFITNENAGSLIVTVIRTNGSTGTVTVDYFTKDGSAVAGVGQNGDDYTSVRGTLTFPAGVTERTITILLHDDYIVENDESFYIVLTNAAGGAKLPGGTDTSTEIATCTIIDNDFFSGRLNFSATNYFVSEENNQVVITVTRSGGNVGPLAVTVITSNETAIAGSDYVYTSNRLSWVNGETTSKTVVIPILDDALVESNETFKVSLVNPSVQGSIGSIGSATVNIIDDDSYGTFQISQQTYLNDENGTELIVTVKRIGGTAGAVSVNYSTIDGSAIANVHYIPTSGVLNFAPGEVSKTFNVKVIDNDSQDGDRIFNVVLSNPQGGATLGAVSNAEIVIVDNESYAIPAGSIDTSFTTGVGPNRPVHSIVIQPDGYILIGGEFTAYNNIIRNGIARIDTIGRVDQCFDIGGGFNEQISAMALQPDGRIVVGGFFTSVNGINRSRIARLNKDGTVDTFFNPGSGADNPIHTLAIQSDGRILVGGSFNTFNGVSKPGLVRLNTNGTIHAWFDVGPGGVDGSVYAIAIQSDGKILIGGSFNRVNFKPLKGIARLNVDGSVDSTFNPGGGFNDAVRSIAIQPDGKIIAGGSFTNFNGQTCNY